MSGHSKWSNIKHKKARSDEKRGKEFTKLAKEITIAARMGGGDPDSNARLKLTIQKAKALNIPNENITRAIKKGTGELDSEAFEELFYEGYASGGVAVMLEIATDNRNRTAADIRHLFAKHGGSLGETGCVSWMFDKVGLISVDRENIENFDFDEFFLAAAEMGAEDVREEEDTLEIITAADALMDIQERVSAEYPVISAELIMMPQNMTEISDEETAGKVLKLIDVLEDHDDVQNVFANFSIDDELLEKINF